MIPPVSACPSIWKNVDAVSDSPNANAHISGCRPRLLGSFAGWKPTVPSLGIWNIWGASNCDHPKQYRISGLHCSMKFALYGAFASVTWMYGMPFAAQTGDKSKKSEFIRDCALVTTPTGQCALEINVFKKYAEDFTHPINTIRMPLSPVKIYQFILFEIMFSGCSQYLEPPHRIHSSPRPFDS